MKVYLIVEVDSEGRQYVTRTCFSNKENAEEYCNYHNNEIFEYLQYCRDNYEVPDYYSLFEVQEIEVIENAY